jgi:acetylornithine/succinyldiaminopimelate/putrescine aminotransferase
MTWGYDHPGLTALLREGLDSGIVWDNHSNIPGAPVKQLSRKLIELANPGADLEALQQDDTQLNTVLLGIVTGTVACAAALKMMLLHYERVKASLGDPVFIMLEGNYHGTDLLAQRLRGMWEPYFTGLEVVFVQPNDGEELQEAFVNYGERIAGFWAEPIMMNREAIRVEHEYLRLARSLTREHGALMALDEIQTGFWYPEVFYTLRTGVEPDFLILGKGMAAGFHPLSAVIYRGNYDLLAQYDAISTNGNAALAALLSLGCIALIEEHAQEIGDRGRSFEKGMERLAASHPDMLVESRGEGHMSGLKFRRVEDALGFHRACLERGLWLRVHAYHEGHSTILTKFALPLTEEISSWALQAMDELLKLRPWQ